MSWDDRVVEQIVSNSTQNRLFWDLSDLVLEGRLRDVEHEAV